MGKIILVFVFFSIIFLGGCGKNSNDSATGFPTDATAVCKDGSVSYSKTIAETCIENGGVKDWINKPEN